MSTRSLALTLAVLLVSGVASADPLPPRRHDYQPGWALQRGAYDEAVALAAVAIAKSPADPWPHYELGVALRHLGRTDESVQAFVDAAALFPESDWRDRSIAVYGRALSLESAGRCEQASGAYTDYASLVRPFDAVRADTALTYAAACRPQTTPDPQLSAVTSAVLRGENARALALIAADPSPSPWLDYNRGVAFAGLGRTDAAVESFRKAESSFGADERGRSISVWGRARALVDSGRCSEAKAAFEQYAFLVRGADPESADLALSRGRGCLIGATQTATLAKR